MNELAKYLANYMWRENRKKSFAEAYHSGSGIVWNTIRCEEIIQQGIKAFESTEAVRVLVVSEKQQDKTVC